MSYKIIDVSRYNGIIDWDKVKADGVQGAFLKTVSTNSAYGGLYIDPTYERNYRECKRVGIPVGAYYYTYATDKAYADKELAWFKQAVDNKSFELPLVVDVEDNLLKPLTTDALTSLVAYELETVQSWGAYAMLYTYLNYKNTELDMNRLTAYDLWLARYIAKKPNVAMGAWQFTSTAKVNGISGNCDMSYAYKDYPTIIKNAGLNDFTKPHTPEPTPDPPVETDPVEEFTESDVGVITKLIKWLIRIFGVKL